MRTRWTGIVVSAALGAACASEPEVGGQAGPKGAAPDPTTLEPTTPPEPPQSTTTTTAPACELELAPAGEVAVDEACRYACPVDDPAWEVQTEWQAEADGFLFVLPAVAHLDDDDGDGLVGPGDIPDVVSSVFGSIPRTLDVWSGAGTLTASVPLDLNPYLGAFAVADLDLDGDSEIVAVVDATSESWLVALEPTGEVRWTAEPFSNTVGSTIYGGACLPVAADLEGDGDVEVICGTMAVDGATGATLYHNPFEPDGRSSTPTIADLDLDGVQETIVGGRVLDPAGNLLWQVPPVSAYEPSLFPAVIQLDADPEGEVVFGAAGLVLAYEHDGTFAWSVPVGDRPSAPCTGDFDGDGAIEIGVAASPNLAVLETDGTIAWSVTLEDTTPPASCAAFDFDRDGRAELAYAGEEAFGLYCGADGTVLFQDPTHHPGNANEYPVIADVDADGAAEVVVGRAESTPGPAGGFVVYGNDDAWPGTGQVWPGFDYRVTNQTDQGQVVLGQPTWQEHNLVRSRPIDGPLVAPQEGTPRPEIGLALTDRCEADCEGVGAELAVQVWNAGTADVPEGLVLEARVVTPTDEVVVDSIVLPALPSGSAAAAVELEIPAGDPREVVLEVVDPADLLARECDPTDNLLVVSDLCDGGAR